MFRIYKQNYYYIMGLAKCFTTIGALFMLLFGIGVVGGTAYLWINDDFFLGNTNFKYTFLGISLGVGIVVVLGAADGMYGICKVHNCFWGKHKPRRFLLQGKFRAGQCKAVREMTDKRPCNVYCSAVKLNVNSVSGTPSASR